MDVHEIAELVVAAARPALADVILERALISEEVGEGGDPVLDIRIVYDDRTAQPTGEQMLDAQIDLQDALRLGGESRLPVVSFIARSEVDQAA